MIKDVGPMYEALDMLTVFMESGRTFSFYDVEIVTDNETVIVFDYAAMSDGRKKRGRFYKHRIVGESKTPAGCD